MDQFQSDIFTDKEETGKDIHKVLPILIPSTNTPLLNLYVLNFDSWYEIKDLARAEQDGVH